MKRILGTVLFTVLATLVVVTAVHNETLQEVSTLKISNRSLQVVQIPLYVNRLDFLEYTFPTTLNYELVLFVMNDLKMYLYTNQLEGQIFLGNIVELFKTEGLQIKNIAFCIHNHNVPSRFSPPDIKMHQRLKDNGFTGKFGIYYPFTGTVIYDER